MSASEFDALSERLFTLFSTPAFLAMRGLANEVPIYVQAYDVAHEDAVRRLVGALTERLRATGLVVSSVDLFELVLQELEADHLLADLLDAEAGMTRADLLETLQNYSDPRTHLVPRLVRAIGGGPDGTADTQLSLITGPGRLYPFLRTHTILESLQPAMFRHPVVIFFPGEYTQDPGGGSHLNLFGKYPSPRLQNAYYRATNLAHLRV